MTIEKNDTEFKWSRRDHNGDLFREGRFYRFIKRPYESGKNLTHAAFFIGYIEREPYFIRVDHQNGVWHVTNELAVLNHNERRSLTPFFELTKADLIESQPKEERKAFYKKLETLEKRIAFLKSK